MVKGTRYLLYNEELKAFYERLKANGKHTTTAQIAVMRKLVVIAHALYKNDEHYNPQKYRQRCGAKEEQSGEKKMIA